MILTEILSKYLLIGAAALVVTLTGTTTFYKLRNNSARSELAVQVEKVKNVEKSLDVEKANRTVLKSQIDKQNAALDALNKLYEEKKAAVVVVEEKAKVERAKSVALASEIRSLKSNVSKDDCTQADEIYKKYR